MHYDYGLDNVFTGVCRFGGGGVAISGPMSSGRGGLGVDMSSGVVLSRGGHVYGVSPVRWVCLGGGCWG